MSPSASRANSRCPAAPATICRSRCRRVTPLSTTLEGRNFFRVEAHLESGWDRLRPGMEGVGKVVVDQRRLIWIWTHGLTDWLRLAWWKWGL